LISTPTPPTPSLLCHRGRYRDIKCAIKLIYTMDLTEDVIQRVAAEANILSSMKNPNIVKIYGISVLPPRSVNPLLLLFSSSSLFCAFM
jgi:hypothetical protein